MKPIYVSACALNQTPLDWQGNADNILRCLNEARKQGAQIVCLPELCLTGYGCEDAFLSANTHHQAWQMLRSLLEETKQLIVCVGLPIFHHNTVFNAVATIVDGKIVGIICKRYLAGDGIHYEPRWFKPWPLQVRDTFVAPDTGEEIPLGDLIIEVSGLRIGFEICEDAWVARRPGSDLAANAVDLILNPSASHFAFGKREIRRRFVQEGSRAFGVSYVYANLLGNEAGRALYDGQTLIASDGKILSEGPRFFAGPFTVITTEINVNLTRLAQARTTSHRITLPSHSNPLLVRAEYRWSESTGTNNEPSAIPAWENSATLKEEEFTRAVSMGLFDYLRKSHTRGFTVSLSGGADSAAVVCLIHLMVQRYLENNPTWFFQCLPFLQQSHDAKEITHQLLITAYQATKHSGSVTQHAAEALAHAIGAKHYHLDLSDIHQGYLTMMESALNRPLSWERDDIALQNIQARLRAPGIWMLANLSQSLLLTTSNRSEAAVGYATMDGDTAGSLAPIAGIDKAWLRSWLLWLESDLPILHVINEQQPTAELRPASAHQTDEDDLMPYPLLDAMERAAIRDKQSPAEVLAEMSKKFPHYQRNQLMLWTKRFFQLWARNQWKRERYAPSFHLDDENLDPKTWCRWPILSGSFEKELEELG